MYVSAGLKELIILSSTVIPHYNDSIFPKDVAIKLNLLLYRILNEQIDM